MTLFADGSIGGHAGPETIRANREGRLTAAQASALAARARRSRITRWVKFGFTIVVAALVAAVVVSYPRITLAGALMPVVVALLGAVVFRPWSDPLGADVRGGSVESVVGKAVTPKLDLLRRLAWMLLASGSSYHGSWERADRLLEIGRTRFVVSERLATAVVGLSRVQAYYLPRSKTVLAVSLDADHLD